VTAPAAPAAQGRGHRDRLTGVVLGDGCGRYTYVQLQSGDARWAAGLQTVAIGDTWNYGRDAYGDFGATLKRTFERSILCPKFAEGQARTGRG
jgi:hypothetical protein